MFVIRVRIHKETPFCRTSDRMEKKVWVQPLQRLVGVQRAKPSGAEKRRDLFDLLCGPGRSTQCGGYRPGGTAVPDPEGGAGGGTVVAAGTPEEICEVEESYTGQYLKGILER